MPETAPTPPANAAPASGVTPAAPAAPAAPANPPVPAAAAPAAPAPVAAAPAAPAAAAAPAAPAPVELTLPAGSTLPKEHVAAIKAFAEAHKLPAEAAQAILDRDHAAVQAQNDGWKQTVSTFEAQVKADPEIGGAKFDATLTAAKAALERFGSPALRDALNQTGLGSHPELIRLLAKVHGVTAEDRHVGAPLPTTVGPKPLKDVLYAKT